MVLYIVCIEFVLLNIIYIARLALELSLGICFVTNALESIHVLTQITAIILFCIR